VVEVRPAKQSRIPFSTNTLGLNRSMRNEASTLETDLDRTTALLIVFIIHTCLSQHCHFIP